jgi:8-oxo-dGTP diphosphatase
VIPSDGFYGRSHIIEAEGGSEKRERHQEGQGQPNQVLYNVTGIPIFFVKQTESEVIDMRTVTAAILIRGDKVFIGQRKAGKQLENSWEFPGGKLETGETQRECLVREMREEFGVEVAVQEFFGESNYDYSHGSIRLVAYLVDWIDGEMSPVDHQDCRWVSFDDLKSYEFVPADVPFVQKLIKDRHVV